MRIAVEAVGIGNIARFKVQSGVWRLRIPTAWQDGTSPHSIGGRVAFPTLRPPRLSAVWGPAPWTKRGKTHGRCHFGRGRPVAGPSGKRCRRKLTRRRHENRRPPRRPLADARSGTSRRRLRVRRRIGNVAPFESASTTGQRRAGSRRPENIARFIRDGSFCGNRRILLTWRAPALAGGGAGRDAAFPWSCRRCRDAAFPWSCRGQCVPTICRAPSCELVNPHQCSSSTGVRPRESRALVSAPASSRTSITSAEL